MYDVYDTCEEEGAGEIYVKCTVLVRLRTDYRFALTLYACICISVCLYMYRCFLDVVRAKTSAYADDDAC